MRFFKNLFKKSKASKQGQVVYNLGDAFKQTLEVLEKYKRVAYLPIVKENDPTFSTDSKIGGFPYLRHENDWPICPNCQQNMQLFLQLNLDELPVKKEEGLIQLFYCTSSQGCESELGAFSPFSKGAHCRRVEIERPGAQIVPTIEEVFAEKKIVAWQAVDDYPHFEEYDLIGLDLDIEDEVFELMESKEMGMPVEADKLFGWPYWIQSVEYPNDRKTGDQMELLFQLISNDNLPYMFGDVGIGHLTQSPVDQNELGFGWACT